MYSDIGEAFDSSLKKQIEALERNRKELAQQTFNNKWIANPSRTVEKDNISLSTYDTISTLNTRDNSSFCDTISMPSIASTCSVKTNKVALKHKTHKEYIELFKGEIDGSLKLSKAESDDIYNHIKTCNTCKKDINNNMNCDASQISQASQYSVEPFDTRSFEESFKEPLKEFIENTFTDTIKKHKKQNKSKNTVNCVNGINVKDVLLILVVGIMIIFLIDLLMKLSKYC